MQLHRIGEEKFVSWAKETFKGDKSQEELTSILLINLGVLAKLLSDGRQYLMGSKPSMPDFIVFELTQFAKKLSNQTFDYYPYL